MKITVAAFYADIPGKLSRLTEFLPLIRASHEALSITNPDAEYIILTDMPTSKLLGRVSVRNTVVCPEEMPLMVKIIFAQRFFVKSCHSDLIVLPDVDCIANRDLTEVIPDGVGMAITHRGRKFEYRVNNLAYIRDRDLGYWFLDRAYKLLKQWPREKQEWEGDQEAWQAALAPPPAATLWYDFEDLGSDILVSRPEGRDIHLYPCATHNCFMNDAGIFKDNHKNAYMVHLKGPRKRHLDSWMQYRFGDVRPRRSPADAMSLRVRIGRDS